MDRRRGQSFGDRSRIASEKKQGEKRTQRTSEAWVQAPGYVGDQGEIEPMKYIGFILWVFFVALMFFSKVLIIKARKEQNREIRKSKKELWREKEVIDNILKRD